MRAPLLTTRDFCGLGQIFGIQRPELFWDKKPVFSNQLSVEVDFASAVFRSLNADEIPMNLAPVSVIRLFVSLARRKMERTGNFLIEQRVAHWHLDVWIEANREFSYVAGSFVRIEYRVQPRSVVCGRIYDLAFA